MVSPETPRRARREPTFAVIGDYDDRRGKLCERWLSGFGIVVRDYQKTELHVMLARVPATGEQACASLGISRMRQTGKSFCARLASLFWAVIEGKQILFSAHLTSTAWEHYDYLYNLCMDTPALRKEMAARKPFNSQLGQLELRFRNGGRILFRTRSDRLLRGVSLDVIIYDEAQELTSGQEAAVEPTTIASKRSIFSIYLGTPPGPEARGDRFGNMRKALKADPNPNDGIWWLEWGVDHIPDDPWSIDLWYQYVPSTDNGMRLDNIQKAIAKAKKGGDVDAYLREYLGYWSPYASSKSLISEPAWRKIETPEGKPDGLPAYAIKFAPNGAWGTVVRCMKPTAKDGKPVVQVVARHDMTKTGASWFAGFCKHVKDECSQVVIDGPAYSETILTMLANDKVPTKMWLVQPRPVDVGSACSMFVNAVKEGRVEAAPDPGHLLTDACLNITKRPIGKSGGFGYQAVTDEVDATVAEAAALAYRAAVTSKRNPKRRQVAGY